MVTVYSDQAVRFDTTARDYAYSLQNQILEDIAENRTLRKAVLEADFDLRGDPNFAFVDDFVASRIPADVGYVLRICNISDPNDHCKLPSLVFTAIPEKDVFVDDVIISSELGEGDDAVFSPKEVRLFFWEGNVTEDVSCQDECRTDVSFCNDDDLSKRWVKNCGEADEDECKEFELEVGYPCINECGADCFCVDGECVESEVPAGECSQIECCNSWYESASFVTSGDDNTVNLACIFRGHDFGQQTGENTGKCYTCT
ncbi:MAG: hypothetical protein ACOYVF_11065, partial [Candidatus Zixiibacteriota bacterium]